MLTWVDKYSRHAQVKCMCGKCCFTFNRLHVAGEQVYGVLCVDAYAHCG